MLELACDFETTVLEEDCRVWAACAVDIETFDVTHLSNSIDEFMEYLSSFKKSFRCYFHNLKFDGNFIIPWLLNNGYKWTDKKDVGCFSTLITDTGVFYSITIYFRKYKGKMVKVEIRDSLKKLPFTISGIAKTFKLDECKLEIDYEQYRPIDHQLTEQEREYIIADCVILAKALNEQFNEGLDKMTVSSDAMGIYRKMIGQNRFEQWFPQLPLNIDDEIRQSYKGGFTYVNPKYKGKIIGDGIVYDVNSLYPSVMYNDLLPYGYPKRFDGEYIQNEFYPLYIQNVTFEFELKKDHIPCIQLKNNSSFVPTEYLTSSNGEMVSLTLTSVDLALILDHYNVYNLEYHGGYMFRGTSGVLFKKYIDHWGHIKETTTGGKRTLAKLMLNSLYGKFATNPRKATQRPVMGDDGVVRFEQNSQEIKEPMYTAIGSFITAYARNKTIRTAQRVYDRFIYADTDSIHLIGHEIPDIEIHETHLGAWKCEGKFVKGLFVRAKTYLEEYLLDDGSTHLDVKCAGMPGNVKEQVTFENFHIGSKFSGKLQPKRVRGGVILRATDFSIK